MLWVTYHRIIKAFKYASSKRTELDDTTVININEVSSVNISLYVLADGKFYIERIIW